MSNTKHRALFGLIDKAKIVSFDIFDTLVFRPYLKPTDIFNLIERDHAAIGFYGARTQAEMVAREKFIKNENEEVTLDEIYSCIEPWFENLKSVEIECEIANIFRNEEMGQFYDYAIKAGKTVIIVSDMYLPRPVVDTVLKNCGYSQHANLYLSSETKRQKAGTLFATLKNNYDIKKKHEFVHIGDNWHGDIEPAERHGVTAYHYPRISEQFAKTSLAFGKYFDLINAAHDVDLSYLMMMVALYDREFQDRQIGLRAIGTEIVWPLSMMFSLWIAKMCQEREIKKIYFLSRDGFLFKKFFDNNLVFSQQFDFKTYELYGSRRATAIPVESAYDPNYSLIFYGDMGVLHSKDTLMMMFWKLLDIYDGELNRKFLQYVETCFPEEPMLPVSVLQDFMRKERNEIVRCLSKEKEALARYLDAMEYFEGPCALVDIGWEGTMQRAMNILALDTGRISDATGFYFGTGKGCMLSPTKAFGFAVNCGMPVEHAEVVKDHCIDLIELFFTVPAQSVRGFDIKENEISPLFFEPNQGEKRRMKISEEVNEGVDAMTLFFNENHLKYNHKFEVKECSPGIMAMLEMMKEYAKEAKDILSDMPVFFGHSDAFQKKLAKVD